MLKYQIWQKTYAGNGDSGMLIPVEEIFQTANMSQENALTITGIEADEIDRLNNFDYRKEVSNTEELEIFLEAHGYKDFSVDGMEDYPKVENLLCFGLNAHEFFNLQDCLSIPTYTWWDGENRRLEFADEHISVTDVTIRDEKYDLDKWNGENFCTGGIPLYHEAAHLIIELDGEKPQGELWLLKEMSQWERNHTTARILNMDELQSHIKELENHI